MFADLGMVAVRPGVQNSEAFPVQPVGRPVGSGVSAVAPNRSDLLSSHGLPDVLSFQNVLFRKQDVSRRGHDTPGDGWFGLVNFASVIAEHGE